MDTNSAVELFPGNRCQQSFSKSNRSKHYLATHNGEKPFVCNQCNRSYTKRSNLNQHLKMNHESRGLFAEVFSSKSQMVKHARSHTGGKSKACNVCFKSFRGNYDLKRHLMTHEGKKPFVSNNCKSQVEDFTKFDTEENPYVCNECSDTFVCRSSFEVHMMTLHEAVNPHLQHTFPRTANRNQNSKQQNVGESKFLVCDHCAKKFLHKWQLKDHLKIHTDEMSFVCPQCDRAFKFLRILKSHLKVHTGEKRFVCDQCEARFTRNENLRLHIRARHTDMATIGGNTISNRIEEQSCPQRSSVNHETDEKPYVCHECIETFACKASLEDHLAVHRIEQPFIQETSAKIEGLNRQLTQIDKIQNVEQSFACGLCSRSFKRPYDFKRHLMLIHQTVKLSDENDRLSGELEKCTNIDKDKDKKPYVCDECFETFVCRSNLEEHIKTMHANETSAQTSDLMSKHRFVCDECEKICPSNSHLIDHKKVHSGEKLFTCSQCNKAFRFLRILKQHLRIHTGEKRFACKLCDVMFARNENLKLHIMKHHNDKNSNSTRSKTNDILISLSNEIEETSYSESSNSNHNLSNIKIDARFSISPDMHNSQFSQPSERVRTGVKSIACKMCFKSFIRAYDLKRHMMLIHDTRKSFMSDNYEKRNTTSNSQLKDDLKIDSGEKPYVCEEWNDCFVSKSSLEDHIAMHIEEKPHLCMHCDKVFAEASDLERHLRWHGSKFACNFCEMTFSSRSKMVDHAIIHTGEKPFVCNVCEKAFRHHRVLKQHWRVHSGERRFFCELCDATFARNENLKLHMGTTHQANENPCLMGSETIGSITISANPQLTEHDGEKPAVCDECGGIFSGESQLEIHRKVHSSDILPAFNKCNEIFACTISSLKNHNLGTHTFTDEKPHLPETLAKTIDSNHELVQDITVHTVENSLFACNECSKQFKRKYDFNRHLKVHRR